MPSGLSWVDLGLGSGGHFVPPRASNSLSDPGRSSFSSISYQEGTGIRVHRLFSLDNKCLSRSNLSAFKQRTAHVFRRHADKNFYIIEDKYMQELTQCLVSVILIHTNQSMTTTTYINVGPYAVEPAINVGPYAVEPAVIGENYGFLRSIICFFTIVLPAAFFAGYLEHQMSEL